MKPAVAFYRCVFLQEIQFPKALVVQSHVPMPCVNLWLFFPQEKNSPKVILLDFSAEGKEGVFKNCLPELQQLCCSLGNKIFFPCLWSTWMKSGGRSNFDPDTCFLLFQIQKLFHFFLLSILPFNHIFLIHASYYTVSFLICFAHMFLWLDGSSAIQSPSMYEDTEVLLLLSWL